MQTTPETRVTFITERDPLYFNRELQAAWLNHTEQGFTAKNVTFSTSEVGDFGTRYSIIIVWEKLQ